MPNYHRSLPVIRAIDLMKHPGGNPLPFFPRTPLEQKICDLVAAASGEVVLDVWDQASYPYEDINGEPIQMEGDYEIRTGRLTCGHFSSGSVFLARVNGDSVEVEWYGSWT